MQLSFLIQKSSDQRSFASFPRLIAGYHVFRRLSMPRHPPCTLSSLTTFTDHRHETGQHAPIPPAGGRATVRTTDKPIRYRTIRDTTPHASTARTQPLTVALAKKVLDDP